MEATEPERGGILLLPAKQLLLLTLRLYFKIIILKSLILKTGLFHNSLFTLS